MIKKNIAADKKPLYTCTPCTPTTLIEECSKGLDVLLELFTDQNQNQIHLFPRTISTKLTKNGQVIVNSKEEALEYFKFAEFQDCKINAYPYWRPSLVSNFADIKNPIAPNIVMIDLDLNNCNGSMDMLDKTLKNVLRRIRQRFNLPPQFTPMIVWSGNGYHIYLPISAVVLENIQEFQTLDQASVEFLRFAESYLSEGKSDPAHNNTVSFKNCMLRVPGSINTKLGQREQVVAIKKWSRSIEKPDMRSLIGSFFVHLADQKIKRDAELARLAEKYSNSNRIEDVQGSGGERYTIDWIEKLLQTPLEDHRKFAVWMILPQYLMNCKKLSYENAHSIVEQWLEQCAKLKRLDHTEIKQKIKAGFEAADRGFRPIREEKIRVWKPGLYSLFFN